MKSERRACFRKWVVTKRSVGYLTLACGLMLSGLGCDHPSAERPSEGVEVSSSTLMDVPRDVCGAVGFEAPGYWSSTVGGVSLSSTHSQGSNSLSVRPSGYTVVKSVPLFYRDDFANVSVDLMLPTVAANPNWFGDIQMFVDAPSRNVHNAYLGIIPLSGRPLATWLTFSFVVPGEVRASLKGRYDDLVLRIVLNTPSNAGEHLLDNLRITGLTCENSPSSSIVADPAISLVAEKWTNPPKTIDGEWSSGVPVEISPPDSIPVNLGNAGNGSLQLTYKVVAGPSVTCDYVGGSTNAHPTAPVDVAKGRAYQFSKCSNGDLPSSKVPVTSMRVHIASGDAVVGLTRVRADFAGIGSTSLAAPISAVESVTMREAFSWSSTRQLPETNVEGLTSLWYALIYIEDREQTQALAQLYIHHNALPLFGEETARWNGQRGVFLNEGDGTGMFVFAVMPGLTYNKVRQAALTGQALFRAIILRKAPASFTLSDGSLSYAALKQAGFVYEADTTTTVDDMTMLAKKTSASSSARGVNVRGWFKGLVRGVALAGQAITYAVQQAFGAVDRFASGSARLSVHLNLRNTDPMFGGDITATSDTSTAMERAWGAKAGEQIPLSGVRVEIRQPGPLGLPALFVGHTDANSTASIKVTTHRSTSICVDTENSAALLTKWLLPIKICDFATYEVQTFEKDTSLDIKSRSKYTNVLAQATEGKAFLKDVVGHDADKAEIMMGGLADILGMMNGRRSFAPCFGFANDSLDSMLAGIVTAGYAAGPIVGALVASVLALGVVTYGSTDIYMMSSTGSDPDQQVNSRGVTSHEFGHFALCSMLAQIAPSNIGAAYTEAMLQQLSGGVTPDPTSEAGVFNESFADFISSQLVGGVDYFQPMNSSWSTGIYYCNATQLCLDGNGRDKTTFGGQVARVTTLLHDGFDGHPGGQDQPSNADIWNTATTPFSFYKPVTGRSGDIQDEPVILAGDAIYGMLVNWWNRSSSLTLDSVFAGLGDSMTAAGYSWCDQCRLAIRQDGSSPSNDQARYALCIKEPISQWLSPMPDANDPTSCTYRAYHPWGGCHGNSKSVCDELVDPYYFTRNPGCSRDTACGGSYSACDPACPWPAADEVPNVVVKADGTPTPSGRITVGHSTPDGSGGGFIASLVTNQDWVEFQLGAGVYVPSDGKSARVQCTTEGTADRVLTRMSVTWKNGDMATFPCTETVCEQELVRHGGFVATCHFSEP